MGFEQSSNGLNGVQHSLCSAALVDSHEIKEKKKASSTTIHFGSNRRSAALRRTCFRQPFTKRLREVGFPLARARAPACDLR